MFNRPPYKFLFEMYFRLFFFIILVFHFVPAQVWSEDDIIECSVHVCRPVGLVNKGIFGTNLEWFNNANGIWITGSGIYDHYVRLAKDQGISNVRFPGGTLSDYYNYKDGVGPQTDRPIRPHVTDPASSRHVFGTPELTKFCNLIGAFPLITVNVGTGTSKLAASWVDYANSANHPQRLADGFVAPLNIKFWEIGNELYLSGSDTEKKISLSPDKYAEKVLEYADKMRNVDPRISIIAIAVAGSYNVPFGPYQKNWNKIVLSKTVQTIDYLSVHNAYFPVLIDTTGLNAKDVYQSLWGAALDVDKDLFALEDLISRYENGRDIGIAVTEWGPLFSIRDPVWIDHVKTLGSAVYVARIFQIYLEHPRVRLANYFKFADNTFMGWISFEGRPKILYYVVKMFSKHFGDRLIESHIEGPSFSTKQIGFTTAHNNVPELTAVASIDTSCQRLFVNIVSCSWDNHRRIRIKTPGFARKKNEAIVRMISGKSPLSHNGPDLQTWWPFPIIEPGPQGKEPIGINTMTWDTETPLEVPPHSIVMVEIE